MKNEKMVMYDSPEAATYRTGLSGWVSGCGMYCGDNEDMARYDGCTHRFCECGKPMGKYYMKCETCREKLNNELYLKREKRRWDYDGPVYSDAVDEYFDDWDELDEYCEEYDTNPANLRLLACKPINSPRLGDDFFADHLPDDMDTPDELLNAIENFNSEVQSKWPVTWEPTKYAIELEDKNE